MHKKKEIKSRKKKKRLILTEHAAMIVLLLFEPNIECIKKAKPQILTITLFYVG